MNKRTFKDFLQQDVDNVFFNTTEFAERVDINGTLMDVIFDDELYREQQLQKGEGLENGELLFHVKMTDMPEKPFIGQSLEYNFNSYQITDIKEVEGIYTITIGGAFSSR